MFIRNVFTFISVISLLTVSAIGTVGFAEGRGVSRTDLDIHGGIATTTGEYGGTFTASATFQVDKTSLIRLGLESGIMFGTGTAIPILVWLNFPSQPLAGGSRYFVGGLVGPVIGVGGRGVYNGLGDDVKLAFLLRPGIDFPVADAMSLKVFMDVGGLTGFFYIAPMFGLSAHL